MAQDQFKRKLTTIFSADVAGYSRLMGHDEAATVKTLELYRQLMSELIRQHRGRVIDSPGDNLLAEFTSVVAAVQCAVATQKELQARNEELPENRKMRFRIGINLGDVIEEGERIYGDGVNIAARLEALSDPGGICVSKTAFEQIETKLPFGYTYLGEQTVKNIARPVGAYKVLMDPRVMVAGAPEKKLHDSKWGRKGLLAGSLAALICIIGIAVWNFYFRLPSIEPTSEKKIAFPSPEKPSIAVLPFVNLSDDPQQEYFSDGMTDDLITDLSKVSGLMVISRNSTFTYKGKPVQIKNVAQELGVKYVLEGSVRKVGDQIRINAQLIDAEKNQHLWAERYDGQLAEVFALQDKITRKIISALALRLTASEEKFLTDKGTENLQAYDEFLKGWQGFRLQTKEGFAEAKIHFEKAVEIDPGFARAYAAQAVMYQKAVQLAAPGLRQGLGVTSHAALNEIRTKPHFLLKKAMKKPTAQAHGLMSQYYLFRWQHDEALAEIERAVAMDPNDPELYNWMSNILWFMGKNREAIESAKMGLRLEPTNPAAYLLQLAKANLPDGNLKESSELLERVIRLNPDFAGSAALIKAIIFGIHDQSEEARTAYEIFLKSRMSPVRGLKSIILYFPFTNPKTMDSFAVALIKAGVPGSPTDYDRLSRENMINGQEVKSLLFGRKVAGTSWATGEQLWWEWAKSGEFKFMQGTHQDTGISWVEGDVLLIQFEKLYGGFPFGMTIFRNPDGSREGKNEFFMVSDLRSITPFSPTE